LWCYPGGNRLPTDLPKSAYLLNMKAKSNRKFLIMTYFLQLILRIWPFHSSKGAELGPFSPWKILYEYMSKSYLVPCIFAKLFLLKNTFCIAGGSRSFPGPNLMEAVESSWHPFLSWKAHVRWCDLDRENGIQLEGTSPIHLTVFSFSWWCA